jgi:hypothetical protein
LGKTTNSPKTIFKPPKQHKYVLFVPIYLPGEICAIYPDIMPHSKRKKIDGTSWDLNSICYNKNQGRKKKTQIQLVRSITNQIIEYSSLIKLLDCRNSLMPAKSGEKIATN